MQCSITCGAPKRNYSATVHLSEKYVHWCLDIDVKQVQCVLHRMRFVHKTSFLGSSRRLGHVCPGASDHFAN